MPTGRKASCYRIDTFREPLPLHIFGKAAMPFCSRMKFLKQKHYDNKRAIEAFH